MSSPGEKDLEVDLQTLILLLSENIISFALHYHKTFTHTTAKLNPNMKGPFKSIYDILGHFNNCLELLKSEFIR